MFNLYESISSWSTKQIFAYLSITIIIIWLAIFVFNKYSVSLIFAFLIILFVISYYNNEKIVSKSSQDAQKNIKINTIQPTVNEYVKKDDDLLDLLFNIQNYYYLNPIAFENLIDNMNDFMELYDYSFFDYSTADTNFVVMNKIKLESLDSIKSLNIVTCNIYEKNVINSNVLKFDMYLTQKLDEVSYLIDKYIYDNGYDLERKIIHYDKQNLDLFDKSNSLR